MKRWITDAFYKKVNEFKNTDLHSHPEFEIYRFHGGECKYVIGNNIYQLQPGDLIIMNGLTLHRAIPSTEVPYCRSVVSFSAGWIRPILETNIQLPELLDPFTKVDHALLRLEDNPSLQNIDLLLNDIEKTRIMCDLVGHAERGSLTYRVHEAKFTTSLIQLLLVIYELSQHYLPTGWNFHTDKDNRVLEVKKWIDQHFTETLSLESIAQATNISRSYMSALFKEVTGLSVMEYVMLNRLRAAQYLLEMDKNKTILDISNEVGFESLSHFSRYFHQKLGKTPTEYRKSVKVKRLGGNH